MLKVIAVLAAIVAATSSYAQEVRVIGGGIEHVYGPGGQLRDSPELRAKNQRAERQMHEDQQRTIDRRDEAQAETPKSWWNQLSKQVPKGLVEQFQP